MPPRLDSVNKKEQEERRKREKKRGTCKGENKEGEDNIRVLLVVVGQNNVRIVTHCSSILSQNTCGKGGRTTV